MKRFKTALAAGALALGVAGAVAAQDASAPPPPPADAASNPPPPAAAPPVSNQSDTSPETQVGGTTTMASGATDTAVRVTNGPVPDTPENRAKYGRPMSHAGKRTRPAGN